MKAPTAIAKTRNSPPIFGFGGLHRNGQPLLERGKMTLNSRGLEHFSTF
jgi:hypothetical protein